MSDTVIQIDDLWKKYRLGVMGTGTLSHDLNRWWYRVRGKPDPYTKVGQVQKSEVRSRESEPTSDPSLANDEIWALKGVSFEVKQGEILGIIGRNGAGKSTLLKILSRVTAPTSGEVRVKGRIASLLEVGTGFHPELTGRENVYLNGAILGMRKHEIKHKLDEIVDFARVERYIDTPVKRYSSGMYLRLAFAVAAHLEPEVLIVDEVLAVGDAEFQRKCLGKMKDVASGGRTVLFVSHNMAAVAELCQSALLIAVGAIVERGQAAQVIPLYLHRPSSNGDSAFDLNEHIGRVTRNTPIFRSITLRNRQGIATTNFHPRDSLIAEIEVDPTVPIRSARIALGIDDSLGRRITTIANYLSARELSNISERCRVLCKITELRLAAGAYFVSVSIAETYGDGLLDGVLNAVSFQIDGQHYSTAEPFYTAYGPVLTESSWEIVP
jgi:lipopolysaccharide transport system ATP-binding protein